MRIFAPDMDIKHYQLFNCIYMEIVELIKQYIGDYDGQEHPFLLFDLAHVNENDHTRVLLSILKYNGNKFLPSFLQNIGAPRYGSIETHPTDQKKAVGNNGTGFIDLYFEYKSTENTIEKVIIENKVYGAGDTDYQLARYIVTALDTDTNINFEKDIWDNWEQGQEVKKYTDDDFKHVHVVYLTSDGNKKPDINSLPSFFGNEEENDDTNFVARHINYYPINYVENIIPWIENDVLPNMPYSDDGIAIAGVRQYIESLKAMFNGKGNSNVIKNYLEELKVPKSDDVAYYKAILQTMNVVKDLLDKEKRTENGKEEIKEIVEKLKEEGIDVDDLPELHSMVRELRSAATSIFSNDGAKMGGDWKLYFTPSFIFVYRQRWADLDTRKYSIPSIYFQTSTNSFLKGKNIKWKLQVDHLDSNRIIARKPFDIGNHNKTAYGVVNTDNSSTLDLKVIDKESRIGYYKGLIIKLEAEGYIRLIDELIDSVVEDISANSQINISFQEQVFKKLQEELSLEDNKLVVKKKNT